MSQSRLEALLLEEVDQAAPGETVVVVRSSEDATRLRRRVPPGTTVATLGWFLGRAGPACIEDEDLLPESVVRWIVDAGVPPVHRGVAREHIVGTLLEAVRALEDNRMRPPYPGVPQRDVEAMLESAHAVLLARLDEEHARGRYADFERAALAQDGSGLRSAWPCLASLCFFGIDTLSPAERAALDAVLAAVPRVVWFVLGRFPGEQVSAALALSDPLVKWLAERGGLEVSPPALDAAARAGPLKMLYADSPTHRVPLAGVGIVRPADRGAEVRSALARVRTLLDDGVAPSRIAVVVPRLARYASLVVDAFAMHGVPAAVSYRGPLRTSAVGSFLGALLHVIDSSLERDAVVDLVAHPLARFPAQAADVAAGEEEAQPAQERPARLHADPLEAMLLERGLHPRGMQGAHGWPEAFERLARPRDAEQGVRGLPEWSATQLAGLRALVARLDEVAREQDPLAFLARVRGFIALAELPRQVPHVARSAADAAALAAAYRAMLALLDEAEAAVRSGAAPRDGVAAARELLRRGLAEREIPLPSDPDEGVQVFGWRNARHRTFDHVIVLGATQEAIPETSGQDAVDALLSTRFTALERLDEVLEARRIIHSLLLDTAGTVVFCAPRQEDDDPLVLSVLVEELDSTFELEELPSHGEEAWTRAEAARLAGLHGRALAAPPAHLQAACALVAARAAPHAPGPFTGRVPREVLAMHPEVLPLSRGGAYSTSAVTQFATCAFKAFAVRGAGLRTRQVRGPDVDPMEKGDLVHRVVERFLLTGLEELRPYRLTPEAYPAAQARIYKLAVAEIAWRRRGISWDALAETLVGGLEVAGNPHRGAPRGLLARFLDAMMAFDPGEGVLGAEVPFGGAAPDAEVTGREGVVVVFETPAGALHLRGKVDRLERVRSASGFGVRVVDLKTGDPPHPRLVAGGVDFQLPFYVAAARAIVPGEPVVEAVYDQLKRARDSEVGVPRGARYAVLDADAEAGATDVFAATPRRLAEILRAESDGRFPLTLLTESEAKCGYCELRRGCGLRSELFAVRRDEARRRRGEGGTEHGYVADHVLEAPVPREAEGEAE